MANIKLIVDTKRQPIVNNRQSGMMRLRCWNGSKDTTISLNLKVDNAALVDVNNMMTGPLLPGAMISESARKSANILLRSVMAVAGQAMYELQTLRGIDSFDIDEIRQAVLEAISPERQRRELKAKAEKRNAETCVLARWRQFISQKTGRTAEIYETTERRLREYEKRKGKTWWNVDLQFEQMTPDWLDGLKESIKRGYANRHINAGNNSTRLRTEANDTTARIYFSSLRAFCNWAYKKRYTEYEVFRGYDIPKPLQPEVHPISAREFGDMFTHQIPESESWIRAYLDMALLGTFLIGMNMVDLYKCKNKQLQRGYLNYIRSKTKKLYRIKLEPEAMLLLEKLRNKDQSPDAPLLQWAANYPKGHANYCKRLNDALQKVGDVTYEKVESTYHSRIVKHWQPIVPDMTYYRLRHTWATFAFWLGIPRDAIKAALGHGKREVTDTYIEAYQRPINEANRKVIDYMLKCMQQDPEALSLGEEVIELPDEIRKMLLQEV